MRQRTAPASQGDTPSPWTVNRDEPTCDTPTQAVYLRNTDFATTLTPARSLPADEASNDEFTIWALSQRKFLVDTYAGIVYRSDGVTRAEVPRVDGYGAVFLGRFHGRIRWARAHRMVWIAAHGPIPGNYEINHRNSRRWDNRLANLDIVTRSENMRHARGERYEHVPGVPFNGPSDRPHVRPYATGSIVYARNH